MKYNLNGKQLNLPDKEIKDFETKYNLSTDEAIQLWLEDNDYLENETINALVEKSKGQRHYEKSSKNRKVSTKERKVDEEKAILLKYLMATIADGMGIKIDNIKNEAEFSFGFKDNNYTVKLIKHRPPKK